MNRIISIMLIISLIVGVIYVLTKVYEFNRLRKMYIKKFEWYRKNHYVQDTYCNIYIEIFSKFRYHMFVKFMLYEYTTLYELTDNITLYRNYRLSKSNRIKKEVQLDPKEANEVFLYWKDQTK